MKGVSNAFGFLRLSDIRRINIIGQTFLVDSMTCDELGISTKKMRENMLSLLLSSVTGSGGKAEGHAARSGLEYVKKYSSCPLCGQNTMGEEKSGFGWGRAILVTSLTGNPLAGAAAGDTAVKDHLKCSSCGYVADKGDFFFDEDE